MQIKYPCRVRTIAAIAGDAKLQAQKDIALLGGTLQTQNDIVKYSDGGENWVQIMATGETYDADNCEHPILAGYSGRCMVCGASDIEYAELIGTDGTTKRMLNGDFGGTGAHNDFRYLEDGDTIKFVKDIYGNGRTAAIGDSKAVTLDLNGPYIDSGYDFIREQSYHCKW